MIDTKVHYGDEQIECTLPKQTSIQFLKEPKKIITPQKFRNKFRQHLEFTRPDLSSAVLVIADKTRLCGYPDYLPVVIEQLENAGLDQENFKIIIAYGTHAPQSEQECHLAYGKEVFNKYEFVHHDCSDKAHFSLWGTTTRDTPIFVRKDLLAASTVITMGAICHHYFAGYGGGRKLLFPGCGEKESIYTNHSLYLDKKSGALATGCQPGKMEDNPLAEDLFEIEKVFSADISIHGILSSKGELCDLLVGKGSDFFKDACKRHADNFEVSGQQFETVIASTGGYPKDINFIQSHKAIHNAAMFVADGGTLIIYCECRDGIGSTTFLPWFEKGSFKETFDQLSKNYEGNGGTALAMMTKTKRIKIVMVTELSRQFCQQIGVERWQHSEVVSFTQSLSEKHSICFIPNASMLVKSGIIRSGGP